MPVYISSTKALASVTLTPDNRRLLGEEQPAQWRLEGAESSLERKGEEEARRAE